MLTVSTHFHFHGELALLARHSSYRFLPPAALKDGIEALGVPHTEVDRIVVEGRRADFATRLQGGERVEVWPPAADGPWDLWPPPPDTPDFLLDDHLGRLARWLRLCGFDAAQAGADAGDAELAEQASTQGRILLTRDRGLLRRRMLRYGCLVCSQQPTAQLLQILQRYRLWPRLRPFSRCTLCNVLLEPVAAVEADDRLPPDIRRRYPQVSTCPGCGRYYWPGSHHRRMAEALAQLSGQRRDFTEKDRTTT